MMKLNLPWGEFREAFQNQIDQGNNILLQNAVDQDELASFKAAFQNWDEKTVSLLKSSLTDEKSQYLNEYYSARQGSFSMSGQKSIEQEFKQNHKKINAKVGYLKSMLRTLALCDAIVRPNEVMLSQREKFNIQQKLTLIMEKLYEAYGDHYLPVEEILTGNGIILRRTDEARELVLVLEDNGYVEKIGGLGTELLAKLTTIGAMAVEEAMQPVHEDYSTINYPAQELNQKIDEIIAELNRQNLGQEILFDELQELKELYTKLNKKNFGQVFKGKLVDLAIGKLVENDTLSFVYDYLTHHKLQIPKF